jgi:alpha-tubulin suppressor-like RCC1 family protein
VEIYESPWAQKFSKIFTESQNQENEIQYVQVGSTHTLAENQTRLYSWGWNDRGQLGRDTFSESMSVHEPGVINALESIRIKMVNAEFFYFLFEINLL